MNQHPRNIRRNVRRTLIVGQVWIHRRDKTPYLVERIGNSVVILANTETGSFNRLYLEELHQHFVLGSSAAQTLFGKKN